MKDDKELEKQARKVSQLRSTNAGLMSEIEQLGGELDITTARLEHFIQTLFELGVISGEQLLNEQESWERSLRGQLVPVRDKLREAHKRMKTGVTLFQNRE